MARRLWPLYAAWIASLVPSSGCVSARRTEAPAASPSSPTTTVARTPAPAGDPPPAPIGGPAEQVGLATWYGDAFAGRKTANGERFDPSQYTAAHRSLPFGTWVEVRRVDTGQAVRVRITDRGPYAGHGRIIDLSKRAAADIDLVRAGVTRVEIRRVTEAPR